MEFRTEIKIPPSDCRITYETPVMFLGSCFANETGYRLSAGKLNVLTNPHGTLFNPFSVARAIELITSSHHYTGSDIYLHKNRYMSLDHHTAFSSYEKDVLIDRLNKTGNDASEFLKKARFLFITFGTSNVFSLNESGAIVANCHKLPSGLFTRKQVSASAIADRWSVTLDQVSEVNPSVKVWFTVSPVRHMNDGAHANQVSKAQLLLAVEELLKHPVTGGYFPAYEIFMDDLRDYRYYAADMVHPSDVAIDYVWEKFSSVFLDSHTLRLWNDVSAIARAKSHRLTGSGHEAALFAATMLEKITALKTKAPFIDFSTEEDYFRSLMM